MGIGVEENCLETLVRILEVGVIGLVYQAVQLPKHRIPKTPNEISSTHPKNNSCQQNLISPENIDTMPRYAIHVKGREIHGRERVGKLSSAGLWQGS